jgi:hypothetical protein
MKFALFVSSFELTTTFFRITHSAMLKHEMKSLKRKGQDVPTGYRPRAPHPLLDGAAAEDDGSTAPNSTHLSQADEEEEAKRLLFHSAHHCDTIDKEDAKCVRMSRKI